MINTNFKVKDENFLLTSDKIPRRSWPSLCEESLPDFPSADACVKVRPCCVLFLLASNFVFFGTFSIMSMLISNTLRAARIWGLVGGHVPAIVASKSLSSPFNACINFQQERYAGHSKWSNIKHIKAANDAKKGIASARYCQMIRRAVSEGGGDPKLNTKLGELIATAIKNNMSKATIDRVIKKAGEATFEKGFVEIMGPGGCLLVVEVETDNLNRLKYDLKVLAKQTVQKQ